jgi:hypothetical protein
VTVSSARSTRPAARPGSPDAWQIGERSLLTTVLGVPPVAAVGLALGCTALGVFADLQRIGTVGAVFQVLYFAGCVLAVAWVRRRNLFAPVVQPPLLLAVAVPAVVLLSGEPAPGSGIAESLLVVGAPLVNSFPTMAVTTGVVLAIGVVRLVVQRERPDRSERPDRPARPAKDRGRAERTRERRDRREPREEPRVSARSGSGAARGAARRPASPRRS